MGAGYHTIHHTLYNYNYGHYFTFVDRWAPCCVALSLGMSWWAAATCCRPDSSWLHACFAGMSNCHGSLPSRPPLLSQCHRFFGTVITAEEGQHSALTHRNLHPFTHLAHCVHPDLAGSSAR